MLLPSTRSEYNMRLVSLIRARRILHSAKSYVTAEMYTCMNKHHTAKADRLRKAISTLESSLRHLDEESIDITNTLMFG